MSDSIDRIYRESEELDKFLIDSGELSFSSSVKDLYRKTLLLSIASHFETKLTGIVVEYISEITGPRSIITELVKSKAINRQYHTWFDWNNGSANPFFALFGEDFKKYAINEKNQSIELNKSIKEFISLGLDRNRLVHQDYANFSLNKTTEEIYESYKLACYFIEWIPKVLREHSSEESDFTSINYSS
ncbi:MULTISPECIES: HEPN domain-containing protein [unclassified Neisseria]|uniref:HEPN domain-containing protein n=1 Tax=unclassified Neisseria TaxID=2623750 RepID=UPI0010725A40|nr:MULTISPECIES: HEPN domain-containing protein [unclassified Neisseria]MBF0803546.1 hypothetical protein [Neisseria sp. 19428wB4_WF04]TFU43727.1 hypothetical protein E4T99_04120 [Neisseria sp. WF04]